MAARAKPPYGSPCNGCGLCCLVGQCQISIEVFGNVDGICPALVERDDRWRCGLVAEPARFFPHIPQQIGNLIAMRLGIGTSHSCCDAFSLDPSERERDEHLRTELMPELLRKKNAGALALKKQARKVEKRLQALRQKQREL
jgi:hypothetical protein